MPGRTILSTLILATAFAAACSFAPSEVLAQQPGQPTDWQRFYYYPYVYYPHNFRPPVSFDHLYYRYPPERRIPVYNKHWHNFYPTDRPYHTGYHFILDVF